MSRKHLGAYDWFPGSGIYTCVYIEISERKHIAEPTGKKINSLERLGVVEKHIKMINKFMNFVCNLKCIKIHITILLICIVWSTLLLFERVVVGRDISSNIILF